MPYTLYARQGSGSFAVEVALEEIGTPYERIWIGTEESAVAAFRKINPVGRVPALKLPDGTLMIESAAMLIHLAGTHPSANLAPPPTTGEHAKFLQWMVFLATNVYEEALRIYYSARYSARGETDADAIRRQATADYLDHLSFIGKSLGPYVLGAQYSIADVYLYMLAGWFPDGKAQLYGRLPALGAHAELLMRRPAIVKVEAAHAA
jgi:glutathione S-transferase